MKILILLTLLFSGQSYAIEKVKGDCLGTLFDFFTINPPEPRNDCFYSPGRPLKVSMTYKGGFMVKIGSKPLYVESSEEFREGETIRSGSFEYLRTEKNSHFGEYHTFKMN
jgi:hypothetical protein